MNGRLWKAAIADTEHAPLTFAWYLPMSDKLGSGLVVFCTCWVWEHHLFHSIPAGCRDSYHLFWAAVARCKCVDYCVLYLLGAYTSVSSPTLEKRSCSLCHAFQSLEQTQPSTWNLASSIRNYVCIHLGKFFSRRRNFIVSVTALSPLWLMH